VGDPLRVRPGEVVPVDGVIERGRSAHQVRVDYDERQTTVREIEQVLEGEDYPVASAT
jgi:hypothetical protein